MHFFAPLHALFIRLFRQLNPERASHRAALVFPAFATAAVLALAGCASVKPQGPSTSNAATALTAQTVHEYRGRFAVQYEDGYGHQQNAYGNFDWRETGDTVTVQLRNPLGQTMAIVTSSPSSATLELPNRQPLTADNVSTLMQNALGFALPVEGMRYWLQPSVAPTSHGRTVPDPEDPSRPKQIEQDGWTIDYLSYADKPATGVKRVNLSREQPPLNIKLVLDQ
jgi:outer membrane lipoprotein LolB